MLPDGEHFINTGKARLWTTVSGQGVPLLLFNGGPGCDDYLEPVAAMLAPACRVIRFEPRGCGRSDWDGHYDLETLLEDVETIRKAYQVEHWIAAGHSAGPNFALAYALRHPARTIGLIGIAGGKIVNDRDWSRLYHEALETTGEDLGGARFSAHPDVNPQGNASWRAYIKRPSLLRELAGLSVPCVFINAGRDIRPNWPTQQLAGLIPKGKYIEIPGAAHYIWLTHANELRSELEKAVRYVTKALTPTYFQIDGPEFKRSSVCEPILRALPEWFGIEEAIVHYVNEIDVLPTWTASHEGTVIGFLSLKRHNPHAAEMYVLGVHPEFHRQGIGRSLVDRAQAWLREKGVEYLQVKTLGPSHQDRGYAGTRAFYEAVGFRPLEEFSQVWDEGNPCLVLVKKL